MKKRKDQSETLQQHKGRAEMLWLASVSFLEYHGSKPSRASVVGKALGGNGVKSRVRELCWRRAQGHTGGRRPHTHPHALAHAHTSGPPHWLLAYVISLFFFFCAITLRNSLLVSLELNTKQKTKSVECYIPLGCRQ